MRRRHYRYVPCGELQGRPHIVVDGAPRPGTRCTLSHWPGTPTEPRLWADTSAEIVRNALSDARALPKGVDVVTIDHFDVDGAVSLALLVVERLNDVHGDLLVDVATVGDFDVVRSRAAAQVAFALDALPDAHAVLDAIGPVCAEPAAFASLWAPQLAAYDASVALVASPAVSLEEDRRRDLAVVRIEDGTDTAPAAWAGAPLHLAAVHSATPCLRVATIADGRVEVAYRYESWVRFTSRRPRSRVDLSALATRLSELEDDGGTWVFDGAGAITPALHRADAAPTTLDPDRVLSLVRAELDLLDAGPPAWDPYAVRGPSL